MNDQGTYIDENFDRKDPIQRSSLVECGVCFGTGRATHQTGQGPISYECPACGGEGVVSNCAIVLHGEMPSNQRSDLKALERKLGED